MKHKLIWAALTATLVFAAACNKTDDTPIDFAYDYAPTEVGHWVEYKVDSIRFYEIGAGLFGSDTTTVYIREGIDSSFTDLDGRESFRIERFQKENASGQYEISRIWYSNLLPTNYQKVEDELRFIKLVFPPEEGDSWQGNSYINPVGNEAYMEDWDEYEYTEVGVAKTVNGLSFNECLSVLQYDNQADFPNLVEKIYSEEVYARGVGLIYKRLEVLEKQNTTVGWDQPEEGLIIIYQVTDYKE